MMRRLIIIFCVLVIVAGIGIVFLLCGDSHEKPLGDGTSIRIEKVAFGKQEHIQIKGGTLERLKTLLPAAWQTKLFGLPTPGAGASSWWQNTAMHSNENALYIYISRIDPLKGLVSVNSGSADIIDDDGCIFPSTQAGGYDDGRLSGIRGGGGMGGNSSVGWFRFEAFPRHQKKFRFVAYDNGMSAARTRKNNTKPVSVEFVIGNPAPAPQVASWRTESFPITNTQDGVSFVLNKIGGHDNKSVYPANRSYKTISPDYKVIEDGKPSKNWQALSAELFDNSGDFSAVSQWGGGWLCPREDAWKLSVKFFGSEESPSASNAVLSVRNISIPDAGQYVLLKSSTNLQGVDFKAVTFAGPGVYIYSNGIVLETIESEGPTNQSSTQVETWPRNWGGAARNPEPSYRVNARSPHLAFQMGKLNEDQKLTVRAVDDKGREIYGYKPGWYRSSKKTKKGEVTVNYLDAYYDGQGTFVEFDLPEDAKTVDLYLCVHSCRTAEFIFKPPVEEMSKKK